MQKDKAVVDWDAVTALINSHERKERQMADDAGVSSAKAMAAARSQQWSTPKGASHQQGDRHVHWQDGGSGASQASTGKPRHGQSPRTLEDVQCFGCSEFRHVKANRPKRIAKDHGNRDNGKHSESASVVWFLLA
jgi:hypothetical protein